MSSYGGVFNVANMALLFDGHILFNQMELIACACWDVATFQVLTVWL